MPGGVAGPAADADQLLLPFTGQVVALAAGRATDVVWVRLLRCHGFKPSDGTGPGPGQSGSSAKPLIERVPHCGGVRLLLSGSEDTPFLSSADQPPQATNNRADQPGRLGHGAPLHDLASSGEPGRLRRRRRTRLAARSAVLIVLACLVIGAGLTAWGLRRLSEITFVDIPGVEPRADGSANNWLLIGTDGREGIEADQPNAGAFLGEEVVGKRTDTIMVARVDGAARTVDLLSVPRDLWVPIVGREGSGRINGAYNGDDGRERLVATLSQALGIEVNHYAEINFVGFQEMVDALQGVPLWFDHPSRDVHSGLDIIESGCHIVDGTQGLAYARSRNFEELIDGQWRIDPTGDLGRTARQRVFLSRIIDTATGKLGVTGLGAVDETLSVAGRNLVVEDGASIGDLLSLARTFAAVGGDRITGHGLPVEDFRTDGGAQVLRLKEGEAEAVLDVFRAGPRPAGPTAGAAADGSISPPSPVDAAAPEVGGDPTPAGGVSGSDSGPGYGRFGFVTAATPEGTPCQ